MLFHLRIILRNLRSNGIYSVINIGGLALGMAAAILILAWIYHEWSYDRFHAKEKQLHVVYMRTTLDGSVQCMTSSPTPLGAALKENYPEITGFARMANADFHFANEETKLKIQTGYTDPDFLTMFDFPLLQGDRETALNDPYSVVLTEKAAMRLFGQESPMGKTVLIDNQYPVVIMGVMKDLPDNTLFHFEALMPVDFMKVRGAYNENWSSNTIATYV